ncbi:MAG: hypothetical protein K0Q87_1345 [Neobacillus sp.]|jgi:hypothetical protein|nr:hypothetical protein [Neobacillus sp.]
MSYRFPVRKWLRAVYMTKGDVILTIPKNLSQTTYRKISKIASKIEHSSSKKVQKV